MRFAPEGYPFIAVFALLTAASLFLPWRWVAVLPFVLTLFMLYFFRDPERHPPAGAAPESYLSPADGKVIAIKRVFEKEHLKKDAMLISIFMSPFNVHVNRAPCEGRVLDVKYTRGKFKSAYLEEAYLENENTAMLLECGAGENPILLRQVAGSVARRTVCRAKPGDTLRRGERFGIIKFSSRVDVFLPLDTAVEVKLNDRVRAGQTILALPGGLAVPSGLAVPAAPETRGAQ